MPVALGAGTAMDAVFFTDGIFVAVVFLTAASRLLSVIFSWRSAVVTKPMQREKVAGLRSPFWATFSFIKNRDLHFQTCCSQ